MNPPLQRLGVHRLCGVLVSLQIAFALFVLFGHLWLHVHFTVLHLDLLILPALLLMAWGYYAAWPGRDEGDWITAETCLVLASFFTFAVLATPAQYVALAFHRPLIDSWLAATDARLGIHVGHLAAWTSAHRTFAWVLLQTYLTLLPQLVLPVMVLGFWYRDRAAVWEFAWLLHVCTIVTAVVFALWPATPPGAYLGFAPAFDQAHLLRQFREMYSGQATTVPGDMDGLISFPSFHAAGAFMATWAMRRHRLWLGVLLAINTLLVASTVLTGVHYFTDLLATAAMCGFGVWTWRVWGTEWMDAPIALYATGSTRSWPHSTRSPSDENAESLTTQ